MAHTFVTHTMCQGQISTIALGAPEQTKARPDDSAGRADDASCDPRVRFVTAKSRAELFQARFDLGLSVAWMSGFDLCPQTIAAVDVGLQNFNLMVAHLIDHRSLQFDAHSRARIRDEIPEKKTVTLIVG